MAEVFIERRYELGGSAEVVIRFRQPMQQDRDFCCDYEIVWPDRTRAFHACGVDGIQALILALKMAHTDLLYSPEGKRGEIKWLAQSDLGLPDPA